MRDPSGALARAASLPMPVATQIVQQEIARAHERAQREDARRAVAGRSQMNRAQRRAADRAAREEQR